MSLILLTGNTTLDVIHEVDHFPQEDEELRASARYLRTGGNAANTALVLAQHKHQVELATTLASDLHAEDIIHQLEAQGIQLAPAQRIAAGSSPLSSILLNCKNGSRTIVHYRDLPELELARMEQIDFSRYDWLHFEGRNIGMLAQLLPSLQNRFDQVISLEIEKPHPGIEALIQWVDVVFFSRAYAVQQGYGKASIFLRAIQKTHPDTILTCSWGGQGAYALGQDGQVLFEPASTVGVVDTLGAGDTLNAGLIHSLSTGSTLEEALAYANRLAGKKVTRSGLLNLLA